MCTRCFQIQVDARLEALIPSRTGLNGLTMSLWVSLGIFGSRHVTTEILRRSPESVPGWILRRQGAGCPDHLATGQDGTAGYVRHLTAQSHTCMAPGCDSCSGCKHLGPCYLSVAWLQMATQLEIPQWNTINKRQMFLETASRQVESSKSKSKAQKHDVHNLHNVHAYAAYMCNCVQLTQRWSMAVLNIQDDAFLLEATRKLRRLSGTKKLLNQAGCFWNQTARRQLWALTVDSWWFMYIHVTIIESKNAVLVINQDPT